MAQVVYALCAVLSAACAVMLFRFYGTTKVRLLFWSGVGFTGFALNNSTLYLDLVVFVNGPDLAIWRTIPAFVGLLLMTYGLLRDLL